MRAFYANARRATERMRASTAEAESATGGTYVGARGGFTVMGRVDTESVPRRTMQQPIAAGMSALAQGAAAAGDASSRGGAYAAREEQRRKGHVSGGASGPGAAALGGGAPTLDAVLSGSVQGAVEPPILGSARLSTQGVGEEEGEAQEAQEPKRRRLGSRLGSALRFQASAPAPAAGGGSGGDERDGGSGDSGAVTAASAAGAAPSLLDRLRSAGASRRADGAVQAGSDARPWRKRPAPGSAPGDGEGKSTHDSGGGGGGGGEPPGKGSAAGDNGGDSGSGGRGTKEAAARSALQRVKGALSSAAFAEFRGVLSRMRARRRTGRSQRAEDGRELVRVLTQAVGVRGALDMAEACCAALPAPCAAVVREAAREAEPEGGAAAGAGAGEEEAPQDAKAFLAALRRRCAAADVAAWRAGVKELQAALGSARKRGVAPGEDAGVRAAMDHVRRILTSADAATGHDSAPLVSAFRHCLPPSAREAYLRLVAVKGAAPGGSVDRTLGTHLEDRRRAADLARRGVVTHDLVTGRPLPVARVEEEAERVRREQAERERSAALRKEAERLARAEAAELAAELAVEGGGGGGTQGDGEGGGGSSCEICCRAVTAASRASMLVAPCAHVCCTGCWDKWLARRLECPFCRARLRAKQLRPLSQGPWRAMPGDGASEQ